MGIPGFFGFIRKYNQNGQIIKDTLPFPNCSLFLDFNGAIYTAYYKYKHKSIDSIINNILNYLDILVKIHTEKNNLDLLYIALDGVPPRAKIEQQRTRRYHSVQEKKKIQELYKKYGSDSDENPESKIDTNMFTPGSIFMYKLCQAIRHHLKTKSLYFNPKTNKPHFNIIFTGSDVPGEGEHKIMNYIKTNKDSFNSQESIIIYGLDADLIMLSILSHQSNIFLLREKQEYGNTYTFEYGDFKFLYLSIDNVKSSILNELELKLGKTNDCNIIRLIDDFIFMCFFLGNDFIPKIPWLSISNKGQDILMDVYCYTFNLKNEFLIDLNENKINNSMLLDILNALTEIETSEMIKYTTYRKSKKIYMNNVRTEYDRQKQLLNMMPLQHLDIEERIRPSLINWRHRYYQTCFKISSTKVNINLICQKYLEALLWTFKYYCGQTISWSWFYPYSYGPTIKDLYNYLTNLYQYKTIKHINNLKFYKGTPVSQQELLLMVLPKESIKLHSLSIQKDILKSKLSSFLYPPNINLHIAYNSFYWECKPILIPIYYPEIKQKIKSVRLSKEDSLRNQIGTDLILKK